MYDEREPRENTGVHATLSALLLGQADQGSSQAGLTVRGEITLKERFLAAP